MNTKIAQERAHIVKVLNTVTLCFGAVTSICLVVPTFHIPIVLRLLGLVEVVVSTVHVIRARTPFNEFSVDLSKGATAVALLLMVEPLGPRTQAWPPPAQSLALAAVFATMAMWQKWAVRATELLGDEA